MATFTADVPLNCVIRITGPGGGTFAIVGDRKAGIAHPAGVPFEVPDAIAEAFEREYGPRPGSASVSAGAAAQGRIPGLVRVS